MFASPAFAARIDRAEGRLCSDLTRAIRLAKPGERAEVFDIGGGVAVFAGTGSPTNKMVGVGFDGVPAEKELERVERAFTELGAPLQAEVSTLADPAFHACLVGRGYRPCGFENVLGHELTAANAPTFDEFRIGRVGDREIEALAGVVTRAFAAADSSGVGNPVPPAEEAGGWFSLTMRLPGFEGFAAWADGKERADASQPTLVGGASLRIDQGIAQFCGAATLPAYRRRGIQTALVRLRLERARAAGCDVAIVTTQPGSRSQQNVQRQGFALLYARQLLVKQP